MQTAQILRFPLRYEQNQSRKTMYNPPTPDVKDLFCEYLELLKTNRRENTYKSYNQHFDSFLSVTNTFTEESVRKFIISEQEKGNSNSTIRAKLSSLRAYASWAYIKGYIPTNFMPLIKIPVDKKVKDNININIENIFSDIENSCHKNWTVTRNKAMFALFMATGCRVSELINIKTADLNIEEGKVKLTVTKGGKERFVYYPNSCTPFIENYVKLRNEQSDIDSPYLFISLVPNKNGSYQLTRQGVHYIITKHTGHIGNKSSSHKLRHWCATTLLESGIDIYTVQKVLGHEKITTTEIYLKENETKKKNAANALSEIFGNLK